MKYWEIKYKAKADSKRRRNYEQRKRDEKILEWQEAERERKRRAKRAIGVNTYLDIPSELEVSEDDISAVLHNRDFNTTYSEYFMRRFEETNKARYKSQAESMMLCNQIWRGDKYALQRIFNMKNASMCHNKFCVVCQHFKQSRRRKNFETMLPTLKDDYTPYHLTLTVPNVTGAQLRSTVDAMIKSFTKLTFYFSGKAKIGGIDFLPYGYAGAVRCIEIVANPNDDYHPHIHCLLLLRKGLELDKYIVNPYSYDRGVLTRRFSDFEIIIQKIFYLSLTGQKVTKRNIDALELGYSCTMNEVEADNKSWHDVFKYVTKLSKKGEPSLTYEQLCKLDDALYRRKVMQGYGILYSIAQDEDNDDELYDQVIAKLDVVEDPIDSAYALDKLHDVVRVKSLKVISKRNKYILQQMAELLDETD